MGDTTKLIVFAVLLILGLAGAVRARLQEKPVGIWLVGIVIAGSGGAEALNTIAN